MATTRAEPVAGPSAAGSRRSIVEVAGPAGAGKSTLVRAILGLDPRIHVVPLPPRSNLGPFYARRAVELLPTYLLHYRGTRWFEKREAKAMALVDFWRRHVDFLRTRGADTLLFDQGPIFRLAVLSEFGPPIAASVPFMRLMDRWKRSWAERLDVVVWVSAPGNVLLNRIRTRPQDHAVKGWLDGPALQRIEGYAAAIERTIGDIAASSGTAVIRFDTSQRSPDSMAREVLATVREERKLRG